MNFLPPFAFGLCLGVIVMTWLCHTYLRSRFARQEERLQKVYDRLHDRFSVFEAEIAGHLHRALPTQPSAPAPSLPRIFAGPRVTRIVPPPPPGEETDSAMPPTP